MGSYKANHNNLETEKSQDEINKESINKTINAGMDVAEHIPVASGYVKAAKAIDEVSGGALTNAATNVTDRVIKNNPMGKHLQGVINNANDSGLTDAASSIAKIKSGNGSGFMNGLNKGLFGSSNQANGDITNKISDMISPSLKIKIVVAASVFLLFIMMVYSVFAQDDLYNLSLTNGSNMSSSSGNFTGVVDSSLYSGNGANMLTNGETLLSRLGEAKLNEMNEQIKNDVINAGSGTGAGVATAAYDFIKLLLDNGINMTYVYGGEHGIVKEGLHGSWGSGSGLDCSAFVSWAMYNGGCKNDTQAVVSGTQATYGIETTANLLKAGDIVANSEHVMLILSNNGSSVVVAHASSPTNGIIFSEIGYDGLSKYSLRDMTSYYSQNCSS